MRYLLPIAAMLCTAFVTVLMLVFTVAGAANAQPEQLRSMKAWALSLVVFALLCTGVAILLLRQGRTGLAGLVALLPLLVMGLLFLWVV